jgi:hypothetical protein
MVREAVDHLGSPTTRDAIANYIKGKYGDVNHSTIKCQIATCSVNDKSRLHYPQNKKARPCDGPYDFLFKASSGDIETYNSEVHGRWAICGGGSEKLTISQCDAPEDLATMEEPEEAEAELLFPLESHLRDFIVSNLGTIKIHGLVLHLYEDPVSARDGVEYPTGVGPIDVLAVDSNGDFVVFELKLTRGPDRAVGQILRYMGWVKKHLAAGKKVSGVVVAHQIDEKLKYAVSVAQDITVFEYKIKFDLTPIRLA